MLCFFTSDLHGHTDRYEKLWAAIEDSTPELVFLGGDLLPSGLLGMVSLDPDHEDFVNDFLARGFDRLRQRLGNRYPKVFVILGNDDSRFEEAAVLDVAGSGLWVYVHNRRYALDRWHVVGYANVPPTPFRLKDWERYDVSRYVPPGCVSPEEGSRSVPVPAHQIRYATIKDDLDSLTKNVAPENAILLAHSPPDETTLDRAANDGKMVEYVPLDLHVGSVAIRRLIESWQPLLTLHGHIHESVRLTGSWRDRIGRTHLFGGAHDGPELALVRFRLEALEEATRELI